MSKMIPQETIDVLREFSNISVDIYGIDCDLYIASNLNDIECNDAYIKPSDITFSDPYDTQVFIEWSPNAHRLRKLGVYVEDEVPIIAWFKNNFDITIGSYFTVALQYIPENYDTDEFEIVDVLIKNMHDAEILNGYRVAPRRVE